MNMLARIFIYVLLVCWFGALNMAFILSHKFLCLENQVLDLGQEVASLKATESKMVRLCTVTAYSPTKRQCDGTPLVTASGTRPKVGTVAVSRDLFYSGWKFGGRIYIEGLGIYEINDLMHTRWKKRIDVFLKNERLARKFGKREVRVVFLR